jgi:hypothetical protein
VQLQVTIAISIKESLIMLTALVGSIFRVCNNSSKAFNLFRLGEILLTPLRTTNFLHNDLITKTDTFTVEILLYYSCVLR